MGTSSHFSALSSWVLLIAKAIDSYGCDSRALFASAGLDYAKLGDPVARFSNPAVRRLWALATQATGDACFGLTVASFWHPTTLHALGYSWLASKNLEEALERMVRYVRIVNTAAGGVMRLEKSPQTFRLVFETQHLDPQPTPVQVDSVLAMLLTMCRASYGADFHPVRVSIQHGEPRDANRFAELFNAPVDFAQSENAMQLDPRAVSEPLATANPELVRINDSIVTDYLAHLDRNDVTMQVKSKLVERLPSGQVNEEGIAESINISKRTMQRRLKAQGYSFSRLLDNTRRDLSLPYVRDPQRSFHEISFLLGFAEPGNFSRAFKRWHGKSPSHFREASH